ncbi:hypothetical protein [Mycobacterium hubeiense]|uniref:hypothetical protein n=1 Tax=Mycobacterium hubeiense TaxID=1867256 RepID=UPI000C7F127F|nr:hypothetical protein [Mycobacterium sp. QGD 101]
MTELISASTAQKAALTPATTSTPVVITEQQVRFATAAAIPLPRKTVTRRLSDALTAVAQSVHDVFVTPTADKPIRHDKPSRLAYLEHSAMSREMGRL